MTDNIDKLELRSEKVRNIIGRIPPIITRVGITLIFLIIAGFLIGSYYFEYDYTIETFALIEQAQDTTSINIKIPANEIEKVKEGQEVVLSFDNIANIYNERLSVQIESVSETIYILRKGAFYNVNIEIIGNLQSESGNEIIIAEKIEVKAVINCGKISFFEKITKTMK